MNVHSGKECNISLGHIIAEFLHQRPCGGGLPCSSEAHIYKLGMASLGLFISHTVLKGREKTEYVELVQPSLLHCEKSKDEMRSRIYFAYLLVHQESEGRETRGNGRDNGFLPPHKLHTFQPAQICRPREREKAREGRRREIIIGWLVRGRAGGFMLRLPQFGRDAPPASSARCTIWIFGPQRLQVALFIYLAQQIATQYFSHLPEVSDLGQILPFIEDFMIF